MGTTVSVHVICAWCERVIRTERWDRYPGLRDGDATSTICASCADRLTHDLDEPRRDAWLYEPQPWGLWAGVREAFFWLAMFVGFGCAVRLMLALYAS